MVRLDYNSEKNVINFYCDLFLFTSVVVDDYRFTKSFESSLGQHSIKRNILFNMRIVL